MLLTEDENKELQCESENSLPHGLSGWFKLNSQKDKNAKTSILQVSNPRYRVKMQIMDAFELIQ